MKPHEIKDLLDRLEEDKRLLNQLKRIFSPLIEQTKHTEVHINGIGFGLPCSDDDAIVREAHAKLIANIDTRIQATESIMEKWS